MGTVPGRRGVTAADTLEVHLQSTVSRRVTLCAVGDLMLGDSPKMLGIGVRTASSANDGEHLFSFCRENLRADLTFGNLEGVLSDLGYNNRDFHRAQLRARSIMAKTLSRVGFNILNVANNHMMQHGPEAFLETCAHLRREGITVVGLKGGDGWNCQPEIRTVKGFRVGFLGYSDADSFGHEPLFALNIRNHVLADVAKLRPEVDILVVSMHWGDEFVHSPSPHCYEYGKTIISTGADVVLGHHPHVIQNIKRYDTGWCCYSLGNFVSDMIWNRKSREGLLTTFSFSRSGAELSAIHEVHIPRSFCPRLKLVTLEDVAAHVASDETATSDDAAYQRLLGQRIRENRILGHWNLLRRVLEYHPESYARIWANSISSAIRDCSRILRG